MPTSSYSFLVLLSYHETLQIDLRDMAQNDQDYAQKCTFLSKQIDT